MTAIEFYEHSRAIVNEYTLGQELNDTDVSTGGLQ